MKKKTRKAGEYHPSLDPLTDFQKAILWAVEMVNQKQSHNDPMRHAAWDTKANGLDTNSPGSGGSASFDQG